MYAPIVIFAFNRLDLLKACINSLLSNQESSESDLFVFVDGARPNKEGENELVMEVRNYVKQITGFKSLQFTFSQCNKGLAPSVIAGVTEVINQYGCAIVVEDDLFVSKNFLSFMNEGLERFLDNKEVFSICGYTNKVKCPHDYLYDAYFCSRSSSWGWATWKDRWDSVDWELNNWESHKKNSRLFNKWGGSDCWKMLNDWHEGRNSSWAIRFCYAQFLQKSLSLFPIVSKVGNDGFDGRGTHGNKWSKSLCDFDITDNKVFNIPSIIEINTDLYRQAMWYNSIWIRLSRKLAVVLHSF